MRVALLFIDGVGIGRAEPAENPLAGAGHLLSQFRDAPGTALPGGGEVYPVDATFGLPGRPQSASNQTAILTGEPAPRLVGGHVLGFPNAPLRALLSERSVVRRLVEAGLAATFANAYPAVYLDALGLARQGEDGPGFTVPVRAKRRMRPSASTLAFAAARAPLRTWGEAWADRGLTHDVTGERARARGADVPRRTPEEAARVFWHVAEGQAFTLFEHYLADEAGHAQDFSAAREALSTFDAFARAVVAQRPDDATVLICSDHGNVEDLGTRSHTTNAVPVLHWGPRAPRLETVADVGTGIVSLLLGAPG